MSEPRMIVIPADAGELALRRGVANPIEHDATRNGHVDHQDETPNEMQVRVVSLEHFVSVEEEAADPLIGSPDDTILPADGLLLMYGDGGAGKTTLSIDAVAHLASGMPWIGLEVPRPLRVLLIENEGPRSPFRIRLGKKIKEWDRTPFLGNVSVLEEPWTRFTLENDSYRSQLASEIDRTNSDVVVVGPLASLGAKGTGTPDDVNDFDKLVSDLRAKTSRRFALWIVHHENKSGDVSGAWDRYPDTLVHIQAQGNGRTRVVWKKARWSSALHGTAVNLLWAEGNGFELEVKPSRDITAEIIDYLRGRDWHTVKELAHAINLGVDTIRPVVERLSSPDDRTLEHTTGRGVPGRNVNAKLYRLSGDLESPSHLKSSPLFAGGEEGADLLTCPISKSSKSQLTSDTPQGDPTHPGHLADHDPQDQELIDRYRHEELERLEELARSQPEDDQ